MPTGVPDPFWRKAKNRNIFMRLCKQAIKPSVDWKKFRELDEDGTFEEYPDAILSAYFRKIRFKRKGACWNCGKRKAKTDNGTCFTCRKKLRQQRQEYKGKQEDAE